MHFVVYAGDVAVSAGAAPLSRWTSVDQVKAHFFDQLRTLGPVTPLDPDATTPDLAALLAQPDTVLAYVHGDTGSPLQTRLQTLPHRSLWHSLGGLMLPDRVARLAAGGPTRMNLVMTPLQRDRLRHYLGEAVPGLGVMPYPIDTDFWRPPTQDERREARDALALADAATHLVYAGRLLVTKGLSQMAQAIETRPSATVALTWAGRSEADFPIQALSTDHRAFPAYVERRWRPETTPFLRVAPAQDAAGLRRLLWAADAFVCPSWHEDENYGITPRQAALCGVPPVVTDFAGLGDLARHLPWGGVPTYPTAAGVRFSLRDLGACLDAALAHPRDDAAWQDRVRASCDRSAAAAGLQEALTRLLAQPLQAPPPADPEGRAAFRRLFQHADPLLVEAITSRAASAPAGLFAPGTGPHNPEFPANEFFAAVQGLYTTVPSRPEVVDGSAWGGFFPVTLDPDRRALMEDGYPGPRVWPLEAEAWDALQASIDRSTSSLRLLTRTPRARAIVEPLVAAGFLVPDDAP